ncbi:MAG: hypothetical protein U0794_21635 [Isosphaeraceae bacterium]
MSGTSRARSGQKAGRVDVDGDLLDEVLSTVETNRWLDPDAIGRVESRLQGHAHPPRSLEEASGTPPPHGRPGFVRDRAPRPSTSFISSNRPDGPAASTCGRAAPTVRWVATEESEPYRRALAPDPNSDDPTGGEEAWTPIILRYLRNHALVGIEEVTQRYSIDRALATSILERFGDDGSLIRIEPSDAEPGPRWADPANFQEVRRISIALKRKESLAVRPEAYADFLVRWQGVHPETRRQGPAALGLVLDQLQGFAAPVDLWESEFFPARLSDFRRTWIDDALANDQWFWTAQEEERGTRVVGFLPRDLSLVRPPRSTEPIRSEEEEQITPFWLGEARASHPTWPGPRG